ncbi:binding-protein-dependent transport systems inner membrane component [Kribbella flavida DSM 17836]|uniref:Binding-protein-dependent transport systems inner membrane component n=1 Tax=Kribbella flavida (strain DSM 17836 / JCM 10339 / NBRC 14399) TaxID=479435 RepID=D2Q203_KRIFD|nr:sugar ABC transporter permease [Kribbella flavida]ADB33949.1 binding-protein-dependent transport systems inner membrane component [Kribbella flavida DSM 17836]
MSRRRSADGRWPWLFVLPTFLGVLVFYLWPLVKTLYDSFTETGPFGGSTWVGGANYSQLFADSEVYRAVVNTVVYTAIVLLGIPLAVLFASLLNRPGLRGVMIYRTLFFLPYVAMPTAISLVWRIIYNGEYGVLNQALGVVGVDGPSWITTPWFALVAVALLGLWMSIGFNMIVLSAGLKGIPGELYEAASLDGASQVQQFRSITVPLLTPSIFFLSVVTTIAGFQLFDQLFALLGPTNPVMPKTQSLVFLFYDAAFVGNERGYAAAVAVLILAVVGLLTLFQFRFQRRWVNYD